MKLLESASVKGWKIDPVALRMLRQEAQLLPADMAAALSCHPNSYYKYENPRIRQQPSATIAWAMVNVLTQRLGRPVSMADFAEPTELPDLRQKAS